jgi:hypothetical protein
VGAQLSDALPQLDEEGGPFNAGNVVHVKNRQQKGKRDDITRDSVLKGLMDIPEGRNWLWWMLGQTNVFHAVFSQNAMTMAHKEGARNVGLMLLAEIMRVAPDQYVQMLKERRDE